MKTKSLLLVIVRFLLGFFIIALVIPFYSCTKIKDNYAVTRTIYLHSIICPDSTISSHTVQFAFDNKTDNEMLADIHEHTFEKWVMPYDTIWLFRGMTDDGYRKIGYLYSDSVYEKSIENACPYVCLKKAFININVDSLQILHKIF
jgi:hypothetical protein